MYTHVYTHVNKYTGMHVKCVCIHISCPSPKGILNMHMVHGVALACRQHTGKGLLVMSITIAVCAIAGVT